MVELTAAHWVYLIGIVAILATMLARKNIIVPAVFFTMLVGIVYTGSLPAGLAAIFNATLVAAKELFNIFLIIALVFNAVPNPATGWLMIPLAALGGTALGFPVMAFTATLTRDSGQFALIQRVVVMPLMLFSGTFFPISQLPQVLEWLAWASPLTHAITLTRAVGLGSPAPLPVEGWQAALHLAYLLAWAIGGYVFGVRRLRRRMVV